MKENKVEKTSVLPSEAAPDVPAVAETPASVDTVIQVPEFPGGQEALKKYLAENRRSPLADTRSGTVIVSFVIDEEGRVTQPKVSKGIAEAFDAEAIRLVKEMPRWTPMMKDGKPVASTYVVYVDFPSTLAENFSKVEQKESPLIVVDGKPMDEASFSKEITPDRIASVIVLKGEQAAAYGTRGQQNGVMVVVTKGTKAQNGGLKGQVAGVYEVVEQAPAFPGGPQAMRKFIKDNLQYPQIAKENGIQGRVILQFVVDETGQVTDPKVVRSIDPSLDAEAIRLVNSMPRWTPGMQDGKAVSVRYTVPVAFSLNEDGALPRQKSVWVIDEKVVSYEEVKALPPSDIAEMRVLKGEQAIKKYGDQAKDGAIEITTKAAAEAEGQLVVNGQVVDEKGEPIVGAIVQRTDGSGKGVVTDTEGRFSLKTPKGARPPYFSDKAPISNKAPKTHKAPRAPRRAPTEPPKAHTRAPRAQPDLREATAAQAQHHRDQPQRHRPPESQKSACDQTQSPCPSRHSCKRDKLGKQRRAREKSEPAVIRFGIATQGIPA